MFFRASRCHGDRCHRNRWSTPPSVGLPSQPFPWKCTEPWEEPRILLCSGCSAQQAPWRARLQSTTWYCFRMAPWGFQLSHQVCPRSLIAHPPSEGTHGSCSLSHTRDCLTELWLCPSGPIVASNTASVPVPTVGNTLSPSWLDVELSLVLCNGNKELLPLGLSPRHLVTRNTHKMKSQRISTWKQSRKGRHQSRLRSCFQFVNPRTV